VTTGPGSDKKFTWKCKNGNEIELPSLSTIDPELGAAERLALAAEQGNPIVDIGMQLHFLCTALPKEDGDKLRQLKASEFEAFMEAWSEHSGITVGESPAS
jgi:hypothetical protein